MSPITRTMPTPPTWLRLAGVRLLVLFVIFTLVSAVVGAINSATAGIPVIGLISGLVTAGLAILAYRAVTGRLERRPVTEAEPGTLLSAVGRGTLAGIGVFAVTITLIAIFGGYRIGGGGSFGAMVATFGLMCGAAVTEEILLRGIVLRILEQWAGTTVALAASGLLFGLLHLRNPNASVWGALAIAVEAGVMLGAAYVATRSLWLPIGLHLGWNFAEMGLFGSAVSGAEGLPGGLVEGVARGPAAISGGEFGPEASIFAVLVCSAVSVVLLRRAAKAGRIVRAPWRR